MQTHRHSKTPALGLVLAGGQSTRMGGQNKALIKYRGCPLWQWACDNLAQQTQHVAISVGQHYYPTQFAQLKDSGTQGPLDGILQGLSAAKTHGLQWLACCPVDTPLIPTNWVPQLYQQASDKTLSCCYVRAHGRDHYAHALWSVDAICCVEQALKNGDFALRQLLSNLKTEAHDLTKLTSEEAFLNVNTPADATRLMARSR